MKACASADINIWIDSSVAANWNVAQIKRRGRPPKFADVAIETCLQLRVVFGLALRQTQGFARTVLRLMKLDLPVPDFSTLSRRAGGLKLLSLKRQLTARTEPIHLVVDSTGAKIFGAGEWQKAKHGAKLTRRTWRKLHLGLDLKSGQILCSELTQESVGDPTALPGLLDQIDGPVAAFLGDDAYDGQSTRQELVDRFEGVKIIIPPPKTAVPSPKAEIKPISVTQTFFVFKRMARWLGRSKLAKDEDLEEKL
ncbi:IS5 family transposase [Pseudovibrio axinellae]|nr:IS5 family transposase [Pseudovibrio axinellae]